MIKQQNIKSNARSRRDARRKEKQAAFATANPMLVGRKYDVDTTPVKIECRPGYEPAPIKFVAQDAAWQRQEYKRQIARSAVVYSNEFGHRPLESGMCLPYVAIYAAGHRKVKQVTAR
ncbi:antitermination protein N [Klebsiella aerogenes]|uniref:transcriptional antitermination N peptide n=1 Tax=Klebsiella aerogenes TaxID=548 RepID=UPI0032DA9D8F